MKNSKKHILCAITMVIAGLLIAVSASTAIQIQTPEEKNFSVNIIPGAMIAGMEMTHSIEIKETVKYSYGLGATPVFPGYYPAVASDMLGRVVLPFEDESPNVWFAGSADGGQTFPDAVGWQIDLPPELPDVDSCGDGRFIGTMLPNYLDSHGSLLFKMMCTDPLDFPPDGEGYKMTHWEWYTLSNPDVHYYDFISVAVGGYTAVDPEENEWAFGGHSVVGTFEDESVPLIEEDIAMFSYQSTPEGMGWMYKFTLGAETVDDCTDCAMDIDPETLVAYGLWNYLSDEGDMDLMVYMFDFATWDEHGGYPVHPSLGGFGFNSPGNDTYLDISALNGNIIIVSERDGEIVVYYSNDGENYFETTIDNGVNPRIVHVDYDKAICTFIKDESVYYSETENGGGNWSTPGMIDEPENDNVPEEYKASDVSPHGVTWMNAGDDNVYFGGSFLGDPPGAPVISGETSGEPDTSYPYTFTSTDPEGHRVSYYIEWGDDDTTDWTDFKASGTPYKENHKWDKGTWTIKAKAKDEFGLFGPEATLTVTMPRDRAISSPFLKFLQQHPNLFPILRYILGL